ncbi:MAG: DUF3127 domain-containing protein [Chitinophagales bacterium]|nr:DUF3127 domain-containing protein [Chitinophagales bacterium]
MDITGKIIKMMDVVSGTSANGAWQKREFVIETMDQYPKKACFSTWAQRVDDLNNFNVGDVVRVSFDVSSREFNERWYTDLRAWRIENANNPNGGSGFEQQQPTPSYNPSSSQEPTSNFSSDAGGAIEDDGLPF